MASTDNAGAGPARFQLYNFGNIAGDGGEETESDELVACIGLGSHNSRRSLKFGFSKLEQFVASMNISLADLKTEPHLDSVLATFYMSVRKPDGNMYSRKSLQLMRYAIHRYYQDTHQFDTCNRAQFPQSNNVFKGLLVRLRQTGKRNRRNVKPAISQADMMKLLASPELDCRTPNGLQNRVFIDIMIYFQRTDTSRESLRSMKSTDFAIEVGRDGLRYLRRKADQSRDAHVSVPEMPEIPGNARCPLTTYLLYVSKLSPECEFLWQGARPFSQLLMMGGPWYRGIPIGVNTLLKKMKRISTRAGLSRIYTNHCLTRTSLALLQSCNKLAETRVDNLHQAGESIPANLGGLSVGSEGLPGVSPATLPSINVKAEFISDSDSDEPDVSYQSVYTIDEMDSDGTEEEEEDEDEVIAVDPARLCATVSKPNFTQAASVTSPRTTHATGSASRSRSESGQSNTLSVVTSGGTSHAMGLSSIVSIPATSSGTSHAMGSGNRSRNLSGPNITPSTSVTPERGTNAAVPVFTSGRSPCTNAMDSAERSMKAIGPNRMPVEPVASGGATKVMDPTTRSRNTSGPGMTLDGRIDRSERSHRPASLTTPREMGREIATLPSRANHGRVSARPSVTAASSMASSSEGFYLISRSKLLELAARARPACQTCGSDYATTVMPAKGTAASVHWTCSEGHHEFWSTQEKEDGAHVGDVQLAKASLASHTDYDTVNHLLSCMPLKMVDKPHFDALQEKHVALEVEHRMQADDEQLPQRTDSSSHSRQEELASHTFEDSGDVSFVESEDPSIGMKRKPLMQAADSSGDHKALRMRITRVKHEPSVSPGNGWILD